MVTNNHTTDTAINHVGILFDVQRCAPAVLPDPDLTHQIMLDFCKHVRVSFYAVGEPDDWDNTDVFRVGFDAVPTSAHTVPFSDVREWYAATQLMGSKGTNAAVYYHYRTGNRYVALFEAIDTENGGTLVVYRNDKGENFARPKDVFFEVVHHEGKAVPRFSAQAPANPDGSIDQIVVSGEVNL